MASCRHASHLPLAGTLLAGLALTGSAQAVRITRADAATDTLAIDGGAGADTLDDSGLPPGVIGLAFTD